MLPSPRTKSVSVAVVLCCVGALLVMTACGFIPQADPSSPPETFLLVEDSAASPPHVLGHGSLRLTRSLHAKTEITLYGQAGEQASTIELQGLVVIALPRRLLLHGSNGKATVSLAATIPGPFSGEGDLGFLPFTGRLKFDDPAGSRQTAVRAALHTDDHFLLQLPATGSNNQKTNFALYVTLWPGDRPETRHVAAELRTQGLCRDAARSDESAETAIDGPFALDLKTNQGGTAHLQFAQPLDRVRARADVLQGSIAFTGGPCNGQRYTLTGR